MLEPTQQHVFRDKMIGVALGGVSAERAISLKTGRALAEALRSLGYEVCEYDIATDLGRLAAEAPAAMVLGVHGGIGENGVLQGYLEALKIPYTGSGPLASALAMDKARAKAVMAACGTSVALGLRLGVRSVTSAADLKARLDEAGLDLPLVIKLNDGGSSLGVYICQDLEQAYTAVSTLEPELGHAASSGILVESYLDGPEYSIGYSNEVFLGAIEIVPGEAFYDFAAKYESKQTDYRFVEEPSLLARLERIGRTAYDALGCRGVARVDVKARGASELFVLEINTIPGMTETSLVPKLAARKGMSFAQFAEWMLDSASCEMATL
ncbi:MAG: D-alanine--D-alanine ligase [Bradymonadaceae bacterium]|nr:D-alanine--D-alanine ligase [Lujinxingiaceae bacterium]